MTEVRKLLAAGATTVGLAVVVTGCGSNVIGADGPQPGVAAQIEDTTITVDEVAALTEGYCRLAEEDPQLGVTSRSHAQSQLLEQWIGVELTAAFADESGIDVQSARVPLEGTPGWEDLSTDARSALDDYVRAQAKAQLIREESGDQVPDPADYDVVINPKFDLTFDGSELVPAGDRLSVAVSDLATADEGEGPSQAEIAELPDAELCGQRPEEQAPGLPMG